jgi:hypothetical protein
VHFEALEQTLRLRLVSGPVDKKFFLMGNRLSRTVTSMAKERNPAEQPGSHLLLNNLNIVDSEIF